MEGQDIRGLFEAYSQVYETPEVLNEEVEQIDEVRYDVEGAKTAQRNTDAALGFVGNQARRLANATIDSFKTDKNPTKGKDTFAAPTSTPAPKAEKPKPTGQAKPSAATNSSGSATLNALNKPDVQKKFIQDKKSPQPKPSTGGSGTSTAAAKPSSVVLAKKGGVEGKLDKSTGKFTAGAFSGAEKARYTQYSPKSTTTPAATTTPAKSSPSPTPAAKPASPAAKPSSYNPLMQKTFGYQTGAAPDQVKGSAAFNKPEIKTPQPAKPLSTSAGFGAAKSLKQDLDIFDLVKGHLLDEGYAETEQNALVIMANMSEEWRDSIVEAQRARENPEDHDKEEKRKYEPVRGEKTPMPPRGDKRREDFEKWYAKHVR